MATPERQQKRLALKDFQQILTWSVLCAVAAILSCLSGVSLHWQLGPGAPWVPLLAALGLTTGPGRTAFAAGLAIGFSLRSSYRRILRLGVASIVLGWIALEICFIGITEENWHTAISRYALVGAVAGATLAYYRIRQSCKRPTE